MADRCLGCHDGPSGEGGFDAAELLDRSGPGKRSTTQLVNLWERVHDRVAAGEMPPLGDDRLDDVDRKLLTASIATPLVEYWTESQRQTGRATIRRLSNVQLQRTLHDVLAIDLPLAQRLPPEPRTDGFVNVADGQRMSHYYLADHLEMVDHALDAAFARALHPDRRTPLNLSADKIADKVPGKRNREPELRDGLAVVWHSNVVFYGRINATQVKHPGWYRITATVTSVRPPVGENGQPRGVWCSVRSGKCFTNAPLLHWVGAFMATQTPREVSYDAYIEAGDLLEIRPADQTLRQGSFKDGQVGLGEGESQNVPGVALHRMSMEPIDPAGSASTTRQQLFGNLDTSGGPTLENFRQDKAQQWDVYVEQQLLRMAVIAFRRPVESHEIQNAIRLAMQPIDQRSPSVIEALREGYRVLLCSPPFVYHLETAREDGRLDAWSLANRLSYFLTGSMPDSQLREDADAGLDQLTGRLDYHVDRLLCQNGDRWFAKDFSDYWLDLVDIDATEPDADRYKNFDIIVKDAMLRETVAFVDEAIEQNRPVAELIDPDHAFVNERLIRYYDMRSELADSDFNEAELDTTKMQRVDLKDGSRRGGLLAQGSILKVTANGTDTSPVLRGLWITTRLLGQRIPGPPADVPAVEPDIRGATTIRELLAKHTSDSSCSVCHRRFDGAGFALENFDAAGRWRSHYTVLSSDRAGKDHYADAMPVDASGVTAAGYEFETFEQYQESMVDDDRVMAGNLASRWLVYATGTPVNFADRQAVDAILDRLAGSGYPLRRMLHEVVNSDVFRNR